MKLTFFWVASCASTCPSCLSNCSFTSATWKGFSPNWESAPPPSRPKDPTFPLGASSFLLSPSLQRSQAPSPKPLSVLLSSVPAHHPFGIVQIFKKWCLTALPLLSFAFEFLDAFLYVLLELVIFFQFIFHLLLNEHLREKKNTKWKVETWKALKESSICWISSSGFGGAACWLVFREGGIPFYSWRSDGGINMFILMDISFQR